MQKHIGTIIAFMIDFVMVLFAYWAALALRKSDYVTEQFGQLTPALIHPGVVVFAILLFILLSAHHGLYSRRYVPKVKEMLHVLRAHGKWLIVLMGLAYLSKYDFSRFILLASVPLSLVFVWIGRLLSRAITEHLVSKNIGVVSVVVVGRGKRAREIERELVRHYGARMKLLSPVEPVLTETGMEIPLHNLHTLISTAGFVQVYIADPQLSHERILHAMAQCSYPHVEFKVVADIFTLATGNFDINNIEEIPTLDVRKSQPHLFYKISKRIIDICGSVIGILVSFPLWLLIALLIKMETPGPSIFFQRRVGFRGKEFTLWKFRTMHVSTPINSEAPRSIHDKRITRVGAWLRKTSLDELPQLVNVLKGDMSLVGPRPEMPFIVEGYTTWQRKRLETKPGLTGLWQVLGRKDLPLTDNLHYDFYYINNQSLLLDAVILLKTIPVVVWGRGAY